jgi:putative hydrolase of the HAD superfamily
MKRGFEHIETWIFDLDNTLYPSSCRLFDQIDRRMGDFICELLKVDKVEAKRIQKTFFYEHGTTLRGLMTVYGIEPHGFLEYVHDIDHSPVEACPGLATAIGKLPGRKLVFTNGTRSHAQKVLDRIGITTLVDDIVDIVHCDFIPKPQREPYLRFVQRTGTAPKRAAMFEDIVRNLELPHELGMTTVLVQSPDNVDGNAMNARHGDPLKSEFVDHVTQDLSSFLEDITTSLSPQRGETAT